MNFANKKTTVSFFQPHYGDYTVYGFLLKKKKKSFDWINLYFFGIEFLVYLNCGRPQTC